MFLEFQTQNFELRTQNFKSCTSCLSRAALPFSLLQQGQVLPNTNSGPLLEPPSGYEAMR